MFATVPTNVSPESSTRFWRISCCGGAGCSCHSSLIRAMGPPFLLDPADPSTPIITSSRHNDSGRALFTGVRRREILGSLRLTSGGGIMIIRRKGMRPPLAKARKEGGHARRSAIINVKHAPRTSKEESDRKEERRL